MENRKWSSENSNLKKRFWQFDLIDDSWCIGDVDNDMIITIYVCLIVYYWYDNNNNILTSSLIFISYLNFESFISFFFFPSVIFSFFNLNLQIIKILHYCYNKEERERERECKMCVYVLKMCEIIYNNQFN